MADPLSIINGIKPKIALDVGDEKEVPSTTHNLVRYTIKRHRTHYFCSCPAWWNQKGVPREYRTCKHLKSLLGDAYERARVSAKLVVADALNEHGNALNFVGKALDRPPVNAAPKAGGETAAKQKTEDSASAKKGGIPMLLATKWNTVNGPDPTGWWMSEKLDGIRAYYDGQGALWGRLGNPIVPPKWFTDALPRGTTLDGELFAGRGQYQFAMSVIKSTNSLQWRKITFAVFDVPSRASDPFETRLGYLRGLFSSQPVSDNKPGVYACDHVHVLDHVVAKSRQHVLDRLKQVQRLGGEGVMLRKPGSLYKGTRSTSLLKVKPFFDAEALVTGHSAGKGKFSGSCGSLQCRMESGKTFSIGSLTNEQRKNPPKLGSIVVYRFHELTSSDVPRFPTLLGEAADKTEPKDADVWAEG